MSGFSVTIADSGVSVDSAFVLGEAQNARYEVLGFHGTGILNRTLVSSQIEAQAAITTATDSPAQLGQTLRGSVALLLRDLWHNRIYLLADPFGGCMIQKFETVGITTYASDLESLKKALSLRGITLEKNLAYLMSVSLIGNGGIIESPFKGVRVLKQFMFVSICHNKIEEKEYPQFSELISGDMSLEEAIELFLEDISINVNAASHYRSSRKISQLTGGIDSRMVLGALTGAGKQDEFSYFVGGAENSLDVKTARNLCATLDLSMTRYDGVDRVIKPSGIDELTWSLHETNGVLQGPADPGLSSNDNLVLSGGYGELLRSFYGKNRIPELTSPYSTFVGIYGNYGVGDGESKGVWNQRFVEESGDRLRTLIASCAESGIKDNAQLDYLYVLTRNRYYVGEISRSMSRFTKRFDPLYSPALVAILNNSSMISRDSGELQLSILHRMAPALLSIPFDTPRFSDAFAERHQIMVKKQVESKTPRFDGRSNRLSLRPTGALPLPESDVLKRQALEINMPYHALREAQYSKDLILRLLVNGDNEELREYFNIDELRSYLESPVKWRPQIRLLRRLGSNLAWLNV